MRYTPAKTAESPSTPKAIAGSILGEIEWVSEDTGYCRCPGEHSHTSPTKERDCRVTLDTADGYAPTVHCFHNSCKTVIDETNHRLRSEIGKANWWREHAGSGHPIRTADLGDPFATFLKACFEADDIVSIAPGMLPDGETKAIPEHGGVNVYTRDQWLERAEKKGGIARLFSTTNGVYVRINPVSKKSNGRDKDVTRFRHTLIESDTLPKAEQERILRESGLPIAALIDSGGHSIHAWVRVDATGYQQYHERRERIWKALPTHFTIDGQNKNPSRFSRCPGGKRGAVTQKLLAVNIGSSSFADWEHSFDSMGLAAPLRVSQLDGYDTEYDPNNMLGNRCPLY